MNVQDFYDMVWIIKYFVYQFYFKLSEWVSLILKNHFVISHAKKLNNFDGSKKMMTSRHVYLSTLYIKNSSHYSSFLE